MNKNFIPLAYRIRPDNLKNYVGQNHLLAKGKHLATLIAAKKIPSMILYGPPGVGKTTLAYIMANESDYHIESLSAVSCGVKEIRKVVDIAKGLLQDFQQSTILFLDETHRFNKSQQDVLLQHVESGLLTFIGATTENPYFSINNALLSRLSIFKLNPLDENEIKIAINNAFSNDILLQQYKLQITDDANQLIYRNSAGDLRIAFNILEAIFQANKDNGSNQKEILIDVDMVSVFIGNRAHKIDNKGDYFYDQLSAFHKSIRGSDPDAAIFWLTNMLESGADPVILARRMLCIASEDIGNADPKAISIALDAWQAFERLGLPEGTLPLSQAALYLAVAPKSNAAYIAYKDVKKDLMNHSMVDVPMHLRNILPAGIKQNSVTDYKYPHDYPDAYVKQQYLPYNIKGEYYKPTIRGLEGKIKQKMDYLQSLKSEEG